MFSRMCLPCCISAIWTFDCLCYSRLSLYERIQSISFNLIMLLLCWSAVVFFKTLQYFNKGLQSQSQHDHSGSLFLFLHCTTPAVSSSRACVRILPELPTGSTFTWSTSLLSAEALPFVSAALKCSQRCLSHWMGGLWTVAMATTVATRKDTLNSRGAFSCANMTTHTSLPPKEKAIAVCYRTQREHRHQSEPNSSVSLW